MRLLLLLLFVPFIGFSQVVVDSLNHKISMSQVHELDMTKNEIYKKTRKWVSKSFGNIDKIARLDDEGNIIFHGAMKVHGDTDAYGRRTLVVRNIKYKVDIKFKEGRYKIDVGSLRFYGDNYLGGLNIYTMSFEQYREYELSIINESLDDGLYKKQAIKNTNNDKKFRKIYNPHSEFGHIIVPQIISKLEKIDNSLIQYLKGSNLEDDW